MGSGGFWDQITKPGVPALRPIQAVRAFEEAIELVHALSGGGREPRRFSAEVIPAIRAAVAASGR